MRYITNVCPTCGGKFEFESQEAGRECQCPHCSTVVQLKPNQSKFDWKKWMIIAGAALLGAAVKVIISPMPNASLAIVLGRLVGGALVPFAPAMLVAVFVKGRAGIATGVTIVVVLWILEFIGSLFG